jgi:tRNA(His) 5'-end guanylyltransferase
MAHPDADTAHFKAREADWSTTLPRRSWAVLRVDGRAFATFTRGLQRPFDPSFADAMDAVAVALAGEITGTVTGYVASDEVSIVFHDLAREGTQPYFGGQIAKIATVVASLATATFASTFTHPRGRVGPALFDARVHPLDGPQDAQRYLAWRQRDMRRNAIFSAAHAHLSAIQLHGVGTGEQLRLLAENGVDFDSAYPDRFTGGGQLRSVERTETVTWTHRRTGEQHTQDVTRSVWVVEGLGRQPATLPGTHEAA